MKFLHNTNRKTKRYRLCDFTSLYLTSLYTHLLLTQLINHRYYTAHRHKMFQIKVTDPCHTSVVLYDEPLSQILPSNNKAEFQLHVKYIKPI